MGEKLTLSQKLYRERQNTIEFCRDYKKIIGFCRKYKNIYLYGTGFCAQLIMNYLQEEKIAIEGFIVSDGHTDINTFSNYSVKNLSEININKKYDGIVIATGRKHQDEILANLAESGYIENVYAQNICCIVDDEAPHKEYSLEEINSRKKKGYFSIYNELEDIGETYKTDKSAYVHNYLNKYEFFLRNLKNEVFTLLELGVFKGASLKMWGEYFFKAKIIGVDINANCKQYEGNNRNVIISDLSKEADIIALRNLQPTIIIDDASHFWSHQIKALFLLFESLPSGGIYILEDLETSFAGYDNYQDAVISAYDICKDIAEVVTSHLELRKRHLFAKEIEHIGKEIEMISFIKGSCIIVKK